MHAYMQPSSSSVTACFQLMVIAIRRLHVYVAQRSKLLATQVTWKVYGTMALF